MVPSGTTCRSIHMLPPFCPTLRLRHPSTVTASCGGSQAHPDVLNASGGTQNVEATTATTRASRRNVGVGGTSGTRTWRAPAAAWIAYWRTAAGCTPRCPPSPAVPVARPSSRAPRRCGPTAAARHPRFSQAHGHAPLPRRARPAPVSPRQRTSRSRSCGNPGESGASRPPACSSAGQRTGASTISRMTQSRARQAGQSSATCLTWSQARTRCSCA